MPLFHFSFTEITINCPGSTGHGSLLHKDTAAEKIRFIIDQFLDMRQESVKKLEENPNLTQGDVTSANLTILKGGVMSNVVPPLLTAVFDVRIAVDVDHVEFEKKVGNVL